MRRNVTSAFRCAAKPKARPASGPATSPTATSTSMPVTGRDMLNVLRALLLIALAWPAAAQSGPVDQQQAARDLVSNAAQALAERRAAGFLEALDTPLAAQLRSEERRVGKECRSRW